MKQTIEKITSSNSEFDRCPNPSCNWDKGFYSIFVKGDNCPNLVFVCPGCGKRYFVDIERD